MLAAMIIEMAKKRMINKNRSIPGLCFLCRNIRMLSSDFGLLLKYNVNDGKRINRIDTEIILRGIAPGNCSTKKDQDRKNKIIAVTVHIRSNPPFFSLYKIMPDRLLTTRETAIDMIDMTSMTTVPGKCRTLKTEVAMRRAIDSIENALEIVNLLLIASMVSFCICFKWFSGMSFDMMEKASSKELPASI